MRKIIFISLIIFITNGFLFSQTSIIVDHNCTDLGKVPSKYIAEAKIKFRIAYGHTSHGSQIVSGMSLLQSIPNSIYDYNKGINSLFLNDASILQGDLGNPDRQTWASRTRTVLQNNTLNINLVMWSWCGQVDGTVSDIDTYLNLMKQLEKEFPTIKFVYMTGHLNGTGVNGNVNQRNEQIRKFCRENGKMLFDFADIESYDPDGKYFLDKGADDGCNYKGGNWADEWCKANPGKCSDCSCAHSKCLNCQQKGKAFWWLLAQMAGWDGVVSTADIPNNQFFLSPNPASDYIEINSPSLRGTQEEEIKIYNTYGECIMTTPSLGVTPSEKGNIRIDISHLQVGLYYIKMRNYSEKFMVLR